MDDCIKSIIAQTYFNMEILYLNGAPRDVKRIDKIEKKAVYS